MVERKPAIGGKMMKKLLTFILLALVLSIPACSKENPAPEPAEVIGPVTEPEPASEEKVPEEKVPEETSPKEPELPGAVIVMVDNFPKARPQIGLDKADLVYEVLAEGGITRFMALYYSEAAEKIGPVRSARYYFAQLARGYDSPLAHAGGSAEALALIVEIKLKDLDEIYNSGGYFWRDSKRKMPHNLYTSTSQLVKGAKAKGYTLVKPPVYPIAEEVEGLAHGGELFLDYSAGTNKYRVGWHYNGEYYERSINGSPHKMEDGALLKADNIIVLTAHTKDVVKDGILLSEIDIIGKGDIRYFQDGKMGKGTWSKSSVKSELVFNGEDGDRIKLKPGKTWVQVIGDFSKLSFKE